MAEYLEFSTVNDKGYSYSTRIKYTISGSTLEIEDVQFKSNSIALSGVYYYLDGKIKINGSTVYTASSSNLTCGVMLDSIGSWESSDISCSGSFDGDTVTVQFAPNNFSVFFGVCSSNEMYNFKVSSTAQTIGEEDDSGSDSGDGEDSGSSSGEGSSSTTRACKIYINQGTGTTLKVERTWSDYGDYSYRDGDYQVFLSNGDTVYYPSDRFVITAEALDGYEIDYYEWSITGGDLPFDLSNFNSSDNGAKYKLLSSNDAYVTSTATATDGTGDETETAWINWGDPSTVGTLEIEGYSQSLPGIPTDILVDYPYAVIFHGVSVVEGYGTLDVTAAYASTSKWYYYDGNVRTDGTNTMGLLEKNDDGTLSWVTTVNATTQTGTYMPIESTETSTSKVVYTNHDIYTATSYDANTGVYIPGEVYLAKYDDGSGNEGGDGTGGEDSGDEGGSGGTGDSGTTTDPTDPPTTDPDDTYYLFKRSTIVAIADQARRIGGVTGELTTAQMLTIFESVAANSSDAA